MPNNNETTTKFKVDISELKKNFQEAQRQIRLANSEFKAATAGMDNWGSSADGLEAKLTQLNSVLDAEKAKLASLQSQYALVAKEQGENSKGAQELLIKINNQKAAIGKTEKQIGTYTQKLNDIKTESDDAEKSTEDLSDSIDEVDDSARDSSDGFTVMKGALANLVADGIELALSKLKDMITEIGNADQAYNNFAAQTGKSGEALKKYKEQINELYADGMGEDLNDVADAMAKVAQSSKETDPTKIKELTNNALTLRDVYDFDIQESMRAVNMLMDQFGYTGEEAFNLIVQGAQEGLNKNDDLLDSINEYSVHYKQLGYTGEEFFNSLKNGTEAGTFSVDKLGDAMKEFGIRTKDTAESTTEGFQLVGLDADEMRKKFALGGKSAQDATKKTLKALFSMDDQVKQNQAGVDLFGTMWEDLGVEGVKALMDVSGQASKTEKSMKKVNKVAYDDVGSQLKKLGRTFETEVILPVIDEALPAIKDGVNWAKDHIPEITTVLKILGGTIASVFVGKKVSEFTGFVTGLITSVKNLSVATEGATTAQKLLNVAQSSNVIGAIVTAVGLLITAFTSLSDIMGTSGDDSDTLDAKHQKLYDTIKEEKTAWNDLKKAQQEASQDTTGEFGYYETLRDELQKIVDKNGKIKKGYEDRAATITTTLSKATGEEIKINGGVIESYDKVIQTIGEVLAVKKAAAQQQAFEESYNEAITKQASAWETLSKAQKTAEENEKKYQEAKKAAVPIWEEYYRLVEKNPRAAADYWTANRKIIDAEDETKAARDKSNKALKDAQTTYLEYQTTIKNYEGVSSAIVSGDTKKINDAVNNMVNNFVTAENGTKESLTNQVKNMKSNYQSLKKAVESGAPGVSKEMVSSAKSMVDKATKELNKFEGKGKKAGKKAGKATKEGLKDTTPEITKQAKTSVSLAGEGAKTEADKWVKVGENAANKTKAGIDNKKDTVKTAAKNTVKEAKTEAGKVKTTSVGTNFVQGIIDGLGDSKLFSSLISTAKSLAGEVLDIVKDIWDENSPSKEATKLGQYFVKGFPIGFANEEDSALKQIQKVARSIIDSTQEIFDEELTPNIFGDVSVPDVSFNGHRNSGTAQNQKTVVNNNFYQTNNSPKSLSRLEIYRQSKNLLSMKGI